MVLLLLAYLGGVLTILSPCILPVLPFVFARADQPFVKSGLPLLLGMAITFAGVATLAAVGGGWAVAANQYGRMAAIVLLALFGITLLFPALAERLTRPLVDLGSRLSASASAQAGTGSSFVPSFFLGVATGLLWAPCAGPILGLVLTGAALQGANAQTSLLLLAYAGGAATSLAVALLIGGRVFQAMKRSLGAGEWIRRGIGVALLAGVVAIALGLDTGVLTKLSTASTAQLEQALIDRVQTQPPEDVAQGAMRSSAGTAMAGRAHGGADTPLPVEGTLPALAGAVEWLNSPPLSAESLKGKVVLVDFWTYSCINCLRSLPYVRAWAQKYKDQGLVVIGVHAPEFAFEKNLDNVHQATKDLKLGYPVAIDNDFAIWRAFKNQFWPAHYFIDAKGQVRHHHFGEGEYEESERVIQQLLAEAGKQSSVSGFVSIQAEGAQAAPDAANTHSPETYVGYARAENFAAPGGLLHDVRHSYAPSQNLQLNQWALAGDWTAGKEYAQANQSKTSITYRFHARDLHLVMGPAADGKPVRFRILVDGKPPADVHGADVESSGNGTIRDQRLYQLIRQGAGVTERLFEIEFLDPGAQVFAFTFG